MSFFQEWLNNKGRVADIKKEGKIIHEKVFIKDVDIRNKAIFIITQEDREITMLLTAGVNIELYPPETKFEKEAVI